MHLDITCPRHGESSRCVLSFTRLKFGGLRLISVMHKVPGGAVVRVALIERYSTCRLTGLHLRAYYPAVWRDD